MSAPGKSIERACPTCGHAVMERNGAYLRCVRQSGGMSLRAFADRCGWSAPYISDIELGRRRVTDGVWDAYQKMFPLESDE